jgi:hypothetical protein
MNGLEEILKETLKIATVNKDIIEKIELNIKELLLIDIFEITKVFVSRKDPSAFVDFTLEKFKEQDPEGHFQKVLQGFCSALIDISQNEINEAEKNRILAIIEKKK